MHGFSTSEKNVSIKKAKLLKTICIKSVYYSSFYNSIVNSKELSQSSKTTESLFHN